MHRLSLEVHYGPELICDSKFLYAPYNFRILNSRYAVHDEKNSQCSSKCLAEKLHDEGLCCQAVHYVGFN